MRFEIECRKSYSTDDADPTCRWDDERVLRWFLGDELPRLLEMYGFSVEVKRDA